MKKSPLQTITQTHGGKDKLVEKVLPLIDKVVGRGDETKDALKKRLQSAANAKLLRLERTLSEIEKQFGTRDKLADAYMKLVGRAKDADFRKAIGRLSPGALLDRYRVAERRIARKTKAA
jgi:hypothetical protein